MKLNKITNFLFSTRLTAFLFIAFALAMAIGTFLDASSDTSPTAYTRTLIYNAWWFELLLLLFVVNFIGNIARYQLYKKEKWATLTLHLAFLFILIGAGITRYFGFEGIMAIREGATENTFLSSNTYITTYIDGNYIKDGQVQRRIIESKVDFSSRLKNKFHLTTKYHTQPVTIELEKFVKGAEEDIVPNENGASYLKIVEAGSSGPHNHYLKVGQVQNIHNILFALNKPTKGAINITQTKEGTLQIESPFEGQYMTMATREQGKLVKDSLQELKLRSRYIIGNMQLVFPKPVIKGTFEIVQKSKLLKNDSDGIVLKVTTNGETQRVGVLGGKGTNHAFKQVKIGGLDFAFRYGAKVLELPFKIKLNDFIAEKYPGSDKSYAAFESDVTIIDDNAENFNYKIYMNHILDYRGYRFFQSSFDPDEKGTILSVNHDFWGTIITYIGYFLLYLGMLAILFTKNTRFNDLRKQLQKVKQKKAQLLTCILFLISGLAFSQHTTQTQPTKAQIDSILIVNSTPKEHADKFGHLVLQDLDGRMMPANTYASELLRKLSKNDTYANLNANQLFLSMHESPMLWYAVPILHLTRKKTDSLKKILQIPLNSKYATLADFFTPTGEYKLAPYLEEAYRTSTPNAFQTEFKKIDQRVNLLYNTIQGRSLKIFPIPEDVNNKWISSVEYKKDNYSKKIKDTLYGNFINSGFSAYLFSVNQAKQTGDFSQANTLLNSFKKTQQKYGSDVMLSDAKVNAEIAYNKYDIFRNLFQWYLYAGILLFIVLLVQIFTEKSKLVNSVVMFLKIVVLLLFLMHTAGLIARWYISGHAPWSDAYESMIYVAWATMLFGLLFGKNSNLTIAATAFVTAIILMIAHWSWMDPAIANLQPVLNSYWLMIHVAVIVASYGPFTLGMILGIVVLLLIIFTTKNNQTKMKINVKELTLINEMALTVGLVMLTIGNFLGGMWANESWGRYWGWDPKETWALISIMVYAFVIHMRLVPGLRGSFKFNVAAILAYASILMTYFGVNFYLSGLHSYASGDQIISLKFIVITLFLLILLAIFAYQKYKLYYKK